MTPLAFLLIIISLAAFVAGQLLLKHAMQKPIRAGYLILGTAAMAVSFFLTLGLLQKFDLSYLDPFQGLSVIFISITAVLFLKEKLTLRLTIGSLLITAGLVLVSLS